MIVAPEDVRADVRESADVCIVGSGAGGAVVAKELAEAGMRVVVLEEGRAHAREEFDGDVPRALAAMYRDAGLTAAIGIPTIPIPLGCAVGGTTTVNSGTCFRTPDAVLLRWESELGIPECNPERMRRHFERVEAELGVAPVPEEVLGENARLVRLGAGRLGYSHGPLRRNAPSCRGCGVCCFGCPEGAKRSMDVSYIPKALRAGATVYSGCRATALVQGRGRIAGVEGCVDGREGAGVARRIRVEAGIVVLAAGAVGTPALLLANRVGGESGELGRHLTIHPCARVTALFDQVVDGWKGVPQGYGVDQFSDEGILMEGIHGPPALIGACLPYSGRRYKDLLAQFRHLAAFGCMVKDAGSGRVSLLAGRPFLRYDLQDEDARRLGKGIVEIARIFFAAGARKVFPGVHSIPEVASIEELERRLPRAPVPAEIEVMGFHPLGTCRMGGDPRGSVTDGWGRVHGWSNLYVADGSLFPTSLGVNPQITIAAFADRLAEHLAEGRRP